MDSSSARAFLGRNARLISLAVAALVGISGVLATLLGVTLAAVHAASREQDALCARVELVSTDIRGLLDRLQQQAATQCTARNLARLRGMLHDYRYARDIGIFNAQGELYCTTDIGMLPRPVGSIGGSIRTPAGYLLWPALPLLDADHRRLAVIAQYGRFNVVVDPYLRQDLLQQLRGTLWIRTEGGGLAVLLSRGAAATSDATGPLRSGVSYHAWPPRVQLVDAPVHSNAVTERTLGAREILAFAPNAMFWGIVLSLLVALLTAAALQPRLMRYRSLPYRVASLCRAQHVRCLYQPIVRLADGRITGAEVLARIVDGARLLMPDEFFPSIVAQRLTWRFDSLVMAQAMAQLASRGEHLAGLGLAFNVFAHDLSFETVGAHLEALRARYGLRAERITLEVTEHSLAPETASAAHRFREAGYCISVDDFGTGYSNLASVRSLTPDRLKIDKSFVHEMERHATRSSLIPEIVAIARAVGAEVVAEGIETAEQLTMLAELGIEYGQGYLFGKPMPVEELLSRVNAQRCGSEQAA